MRELKLRGLVDGELIYQSSSHSFNIGGAHGDECLHWLGFDLIGSKPVEKIMLYTGLKDKNGKEIFDGDIVKYLHDWDDEEDALFYEIRFCEAGHTNTLGFHAFDLEDKEFQFYGGIGGSEESRQAFEVIGNTHENPEL